VEAEIKGIGGRGDKGNKNNGIGKRELRIGNRE
jgi:hypothetical protein